MPVITPQPLQWRASAALRVRCVCTILASFVQQLLVLLMMPQSLSLILTTLLLLLLLSLPSLLLGVCAVGAQTGRRAALWPPFAVCCCWLRLRNEQYLWSSTRGTAGVTIHCSSRQPSMWWMW